MRSTTPILNLESPLPKPRGEMTVSFVGLLKAVPAALGMIALIPFSMFLAFKLHLTVPAWLTALFTDVVRALDNLFVHGPLIAVPLLCVPMSLALVAHESGHWLAALANRWEIYEFRAMPFRLHKSENRWRFHLFWKLNPAGLVVAKPITVARFHSKLRMFALAGPGASLFAGVFLLWFSPDPARSVFSALCPIFVAWSLVIGIFNLLPLRYRTLELDGYIAFIVSRKPALLSMRLAARKMTEHLRNGRPIRLMNQRWVALAEGSGSVSLQNRAGIWLAYAYWSQRPQQSERAALMLERLLQSSGDADESYKAMLFAECAVFAARNGKKLEAQTWKERTRDLFLPEYLRRRCNSFVAWVVGDLALAYDEAVCAKEAYLRRNEKGPDLFSEGWNKWIQALEEAKSRLTQCSSTTRS